MSADLVRMLDSFSGRPCDTPRRQMFFQLVGGARVILDNPLIPHSVKCAVVGLLSLCDLLCADVERLERKSNG